MPAAVLTQLICYLINLVLNEAGSAVKTAQL
jgi:hypothetical protein